MQQFLRLRLVPLQSSFIWIRSHQPWTFSCWSDRWILLQNARIHFGHFLIFILCHCESQSKNVLISKGYLWNSFSIESINTLRCRPLFIVAVPQLSIFIRAPGVKSALPGQNHSQAALWYLKIKNIQLIYTFYSMWSIKFAKDTSSPDKKLLVNRQRSREWASADLRHPWEGKLLQEDWNWWTLGGWACSQLAWCVCTHYVDFSFHGQRDSMHLSTRNLIDFIRNLTHVHWRTFISKRAKTKLAILASAAGE